MKKGYIYSATKKYKSKHFHQMVILGDWRKEGNYEAAIISHEPKYGNVLMSEEHFEKYNAEAVDYKTLFDPLEPSYLVIDKYVKFEGHIDQTPLGKVTQAGLDFIINKLSHKNARVLQKPIQEEARGKEEKINKEDANV